MTILARHLYFGLPVKQIIQMSHEIHPGHQIVKIACHWEYDKGIHSHRHPRGAQDSRCKCRVQPFKTYFPRYN